MINRSVTYNYFLMKFVTVLIVRVYVSRHMSLFFFFSKFCTQTWTHSLSCSQPQSIAVGGNPFLAQNIRIYHECEGRIEKSVSRLAE